MNGIALKNINFGGKGGRGHAVYQKHKISSGDRDFMGRGFGVEQ